MANRRNRFKEMEQLLTKVLVFDLVLFIIYLISASSGVIWLKVLTVLGTLGVSGICLYVLYINNELMRQRSLWMSVGAAAIAVCVLFSLILNFPSPRIF